MILEQLYLGCLSQASYFIGDKSSGVAAVVDPRRDIEDYVGLAKEHGLSIQHAILTHFHADFASGHLELAEACGAKIYLGAGAAADYAFESVADGDTIEFGRVRLQILSTPGHTPESICVLVFDLDASATEPHAVLTGDTLFIGDAGRPDLLGAQGLTAEAMAGQLYDSLHSKLMTLPEATLVYPGHGAGSMCGKNLSSDTVSTIGAQLETNCALKQDDKEAFVASITANQPQTPAYFGYDVAFNKQQHATLTVTKETALRALSASEFLAARDGGAVVLDTRAADAYVASHLHGSICVGLQGNFATWAGTVLDAEAELVLVCEPGTEDEAVTRLGRIGFDRIRGYLDGGLPALAGQAELVATGRLDADAFAAQIAAPEVFLLDVRTPGEQANGVIDGAALIPLRELSSRLDEVPQDRPVSIYCGSGYRSVIAMGLLQSHGVTGLQDLVGGWNAWQSRETG